MVAAVHMPEPPDASARDVAPGSSDHASSLPPHEPRLASFSPRNAAEGNARGHATPNTAFPQRSPLIYPQQQQQQRQQQHPLPSYDYTFDPYAQSAWDWTHALDLTQLPTPYELQGELLQEQHTTSDTTDPPLEFSNPLRGDPLAPPPRPRPLSPRMKRKSQSDAPDEAKRRAVSRASSTTSQSPAPATTAKGTGPQGKETHVGEPRRVVEAEGGAALLPAGRVFPVQIGSALFRLSGASLCSDAPSYFSHFFAEQLHAAAGRGADIRTLYIDRDPDTFRDIARHLQGYHIAPRDADHFVRLFADAQFYSLPRLTKQLFKSDIFIAIGGVPFRIPRDSFAAPGNSPNYFSLGFAQWFSTPAEVFPGLDRNALLRPPSISPPAVPNKSGEVFAQLMKMLMGYDVDISNPQHRANLLKDARYFHLKGLEQRLLPCSTSFNLKRNRNELLIRLEDIRQSGISFLPDPDTPPLAAAGTATYARPYTDDASLPHTLILETSTAEPATLHLSPSATLVSFNGDTLRRITALLAILATKAGLLRPTHLSSSPLAARIDRDTSLVLDGVAVDADAGEEVSADNEWVVSRAHWRIRIEACSGSGSGSGSVNGEGERGVRAVFEAVKMEAFTQERGRNAARGFLGG